MRYNKINTRVLTYTLSFIDRTEESLQSSKTGGDMASGTAITSQNEEMNLGRSDGIEETDSR